MPNNPPNKSTVDFPFQAVVVDTVLVERSSSFVGTYTPIEPGTPFLPLNHNVAEAAKYANAILLGQKMGKDNEFQERIWANPPHTQDIYNYSINYDEQDNDFPIFKRRYLELRDSYKPLDKLTFFSGVFAIAITNPGLGYSAPVVTISGGTGSGATAIAIADPTTGAIVKITIKIEGTGYTTFSGGMYGPAPTVTIADSGGGTGSGATATATVQIYGSNPLKLVHEEAAPAPDPWGSLYMLVERVYMRLPGATVVGSEYDSETGGILPFSEQTVVASSSGNALSGNEYTIIQPIDSVIAKAITKTATTLDATGRTYTVSRHVPLPRVLGGIYGTVWNDTNAKIVSITFAYSLLDYAKPYVVTVTEKWQDSQWTIPAATNLTPAAIVLVTPFGSITVPPCLHTSQAFTVSTASDGSTPAPGINPDGSRRFYAYIAKTFTFAATVTTGFSVMGDTITLSDEQSVFRGGWLRRTETIVVAQGDCTGELTVT